MSEAINKEDPLAGFESEKKGAVIWFVGAIVFGSILTFELSQIDRVNYDTKGVYIDSGNLKQNRLATTSIGSETRDPRASSLLDGKLKK